MTALSDPHACDPAEQADVPTPTRRAKGPTLRDWQASRASIGLGLGVRV